MNFESNGFPKDNLRTWQRYKLLDTEYTSNLFRYLFPLLILVSKHVATLKIEYYYSPSRGEKEEGEWIGRKFLFLSIAIRETCPRSEGKLRTLFREVEISIKPRNHEILAWGQVLVVCLVVIEREGKTEAKGGKERESWDKEKSMQAIPKYKLRGSYGDPLNMPWMEDRRVNTQGLSKSNLWLGEPLDRAIPKRKVPHHFPLRSNVAKISMDSSETNPVRRYTELGGASPTARFFLRSPGLALVLIALSPQWCIRQENG